MMSEADQADLVNLRSAAELLADRAGYEMSGPLQPLAGGSNNRVFLAPTGRRMLLLKEYFHHPDDDRDRLAAEFEFSRFMWSHGIRCIPEPIAADPQQHVALFEYVPGRPLQVNEVSDARVDEAIAFVSAINHHRHQPAAAALPPASEACFSVHDHFALIRGRLQRLAAIEPDTAVGKEAHQFVTAELEPAWQRLAVEPDAVVLDLPTSMQDLLPVTQRCLSPSDFGFHNSLLTPTGKLVFHDFEYAGWDDPARLVCDFYCQPKLPAPGQTLNHFVADVSRFGEPSNRLSDRVRLLLPLYQIKWCCIMLNDFLGVGDRRRRFAARATNREEHKRQQLDKARRLLTRISSPA